MNLTLSAIENIQDGCKFFRAELADSRAALVDELERVEETAAGCASMVKDLLNAKEALERNGMTAEWLEVFNQDNKLFTLADIQQPMYFGTPMDRAKEIEPQLEGYIWDWLKTAGKALAKIFEWIFKGIKWLLTWWVNENNDKKAQLVKQCDAFAKWCEAHQEVVHIPELDTSKFEVEIYDPTVILSYLNNIKTLVALLAGKDQVTIQAKILGDETTATGDPNRDIYTALVHAVYGAGFKDNKELNGFQITQTGCEFLPLDRFQKIRINPAASDNKAYQDAVSRVTTIQAYGKTIKPILDNARAQMAKLQVSLEKAWNDAKAGKPMVPGGVPADPEKLGLCYQRAKVYTMFFGQLIVHFTTVTSACDITQGAIINCSIAYKTAISEHQKAVAAATAAGQQIRP